MVKIMGKALIFDYRPSELIPAWVRSGQPALIGADGGRGGAVGGSDPPPMGGGPIGSGAGRTQPLIELPVELQVEGTICYSPFII